MEQNDWSLHLTQIEKLMKGQPFWKTALFGVMCARRQLPVYERLCIGREWGNAKDMAKVMERFWKAIPTGYAIGDTYLGIIEDSLVVPEEDWDSLAEEYVHNMELLLELFESKDKKAAGEIAERNLSFLDIYLDFEGGEYEGLHPLTAAEQAFQLQLAEELNMAETKEKSDCIQRCHEREVESILGSAWFQDYPDYKPIRRKKNKPAGDGLRFRTSYQTACVANKDYHLCWKADAETFAALEQYRSSEYYDLAPAAEIPPALWQFPIPVQEFAQGRYRDFYGGMFFNYNRRAEELYLKDRPMEDTLKALYQAAQCLLICARLYLPDTAERSKAEHTGQYNHKSAVNHALLIYEYDTAASLMDEHTSPYIKLFYSMLHRKYGKADVLLPTGAHKEGSQPTDHHKTSALLSADGHDSGIPLSADGHDSGALLSADGHDTSALLSACEQAADPIYRGADFQLASALCGKDPEKIRTCAVKMLRAIRAMESVYCEVFPIFLILALRCAAQMDIPIRKINVSELPDALIGKNNPFDIENSMPFGAEKLPLE